ncbi:hypothetical protein QAD02_018102 [Eretmocerus hayati]|uniref:Uncharacterized protein n=1 Tax=Eretmocerus hayati TaxID=131215 RepID=A0ACC2PFV7_9HYME|nr:hypothetical protein QAD02_018102 [Eretmocerus hayati]
MDDDVQDIDRYLAGGAARMEIDGNGPANNAAAAAVRNVQINHPNPIDPAEATHPVHPPPPARDEIGAAGAQGQNRKDRLLQPNNDQVVAAGAALHAPGIAPGGINNIAGAMIEPRNAEAVEVVEDGDFRARGARAGSWVQQQRRVRNMLRVLDDLGAITYGRVDRRRQNNQHRNQGGYRGRDGGAQGGGRHQARNPEHRGHQGRNVMRPY